MSSLTLSYEADGTGAVSRTLESWLGDAPLTPLDFGAEFMCNIGPHCDRVRVRDNRFYGKVAKAPKGSATALSVIPSSGSISYGHRAILEGSATVDVSSIPGASFGTVSVTVAGATTGDILLGWGTSAALPTGVFILGATVTAANTVVITLFNTTGGALDPASMTYTAYVEKKLI